jgi:hypothetical protein
MFLLGIKGENGEEGADEIIWTQGVRNSKRTGTCIIKELHNLRWSPEENFMGTHGETRNS